MGAFRSSSYLSLGRQYVRTCHHVAKAVEIPACDYAAPTYKGPSYEKVRSIRESRLSPLLTTHFSKPALLHCGRMQWLFDDKGKRYLDMFGGIVTVSIGHCHPEVVEAAKEQLDTLWHTTNIYWHPKIHEYAEALTDALPGNLKVAYLTNSGSEANDMALWMARLYTGNFDIISLRNSFHGASTSAAGLTGHGTWKFKYPNGFGIHHTSNPDVYQGIWGGYRDSPVQSLRCEESSLQNGICSSADKYIGQMEETINYSIPKGGLAGLFIESIQGVGGTVQYPIGYVKKAFELVRSHGGVCISDEVQTGFGRTGDHFWGFKCHDVQPDIVTMAKGIGNGFPLGAVVTTPEIAKKASTALHFNTFGGNPIASAVGLSVLNILKRDNYQQRAKDVGTYFLKQLAELRNRYEVVGDVRGKGLMIGMEMVEEKESRKPLNTESFFRIWDLCKDKGVIIGRGGYYGNVYRFKPPMCITKEDADFCVNVLDESLREYSTTT